MNLVRRSGAPSAFASLLTLTLGGTCAAAMMACSASSAGGGLGGQSGGGPLGASSGDDSTGSGNDASTSSPSPDAAVLGASTDSSAQGDVAPSAADDGGEAAAPAGDASGDGAAPGADFTLLDTTITTVIDGSPVSGYDPIAENATINLAVTGSALSIRANTVPAVVGSVAFALDAAYTHTENTVPYTLCSDNGAGTITSCASILTVGKHTLTATPYSLPSLGGTAGAPITVDFTIDDVDAGAPDATPG
jgi:hypothetical protein